MVEQVQKDNPIKLRTIDDLSQASELIFNRQVDGSMDNKTADSMNTTIKHQIHLKYTLPLSMAKLIIQAKIKKVEVPAVLMDLSEKK